MMLRVAALQYCASDDVAKTLHHIQPLIAKAATKASLVTLPECANYLAASREQLFQIAEWDNESYSQKWLGNIAREFGIWLLAGSLIMRRRDNNQLVNRSLLFGPDGAVVADYDKIHMFDADVGDGKSYQESASFAAGQSPVIAHVDNVPCGLTICYDVRFAHLYRQLALDGAQLFFVPAAFTALSGKAHWHVLLRARAIENGCYVVAPAQSGTHADGRKTYGHSLIINPWGEIIAEAKDGDAIIEATLDLSAIAKAQNAIPSLKTNPVIGPTRIIEP